MAYYPTAMTQHEGTGEVDLPGSYTYDIGPARPRFMVTRVRKTDGSWKVKKAPR